MGEATLGGRPQGWFIPHAHAADVTPLASYPALARLLDAARPEMLATLEAVHGLRDELLAIPADDEVSVPRWRQDWFSGLDAAVMVAMVRRHARRRIVEIGSGHSTRFIVRAIADGGLDCTVTAIDPAPRADLAEQPVTLVREIVQRADPAIFAALRPGDLLSIDSSHILMPGSDVDLLFNDVIPALPAGVLVHVHDIFLPDAYPEDWTLRGYNEQNGLAPLVAGGLLAPLFASHFALTRMAADTQRLTGFLPRPVPVRESSFWAMVRR